MSEQIKFWPVDLAFVANQYKCYPGETVTLYARLDIKQDLADFEFSLALPDVFEFVAGQAVGGAIDLLEKAQPNLEISQDFGRHYIWRTAKALKAGTIFDFEVQVTTLPIDLDQTAVSVLSLKNSAEEEVQTKSLAVEVRAKGEYLKYLPSIYHDDDLMGRFLMLFESFWKPINSQIEHMHYYLDPKMTPEEFTPWLASWFNLTLDQNWPMEKQRDLIAKSLSLYRKRGTRQGLERMIELYIGVTPEIIEHRGKDFKLGPVAILGPGLALGEGDNLPYSFSVVVDLPKVAGENKAARKKKAASLHRTLEKIIEEEKPAGVLFDLVLNTEG